MKKQINENELCAASLLIRQRTLFRAFFINIILGILVSLMVFIPGFLYMAVVITGISPMMMYFSMISGIALWQMLGVVMFLVPAIATWWERRAQNNH